MPAAFNMIPAYLKELGKILFLAGVYFAAAKLGLAMAYFHHHVSSIWPPSGIALAAVLLQGYRMLPGVTLGAFAINFHTGLPALSALGIAAGNTLEACLGAYLLQQVLHFRPSLERVRDVIALIGPGAFASAAAAATVGTVSLGLGQVMPWTDFKTAWAVWLLGDAMGIIIVAPMLLGWGTPQTSAAGKSGSLEGLVLLLALLVFSLLVLASPTADADTRQALVLIVFPLLVWTALHSTPREAATATFLISAISVWATSNGLGPYSSGSMPGSLLLLHAFIGVAALTTLTVSAINLERRRTESALRESEERFRSLTGLSSDWYWEQDENLCFTLISAGRISGDHLVHGEHIGKRRWDVPYVDVSPEEWERHKAVLNARQPFRDLVLKRLDVDGRLRVVSISGEPVFDAHGNFKGYRGTGKDVTERKLAEERISRLTDLYAALSQVNHAIMRIKEAEALYREVCRIAVEHGRFLFAWIGLIDPGARVLKAAAAAGAHGGYPDKAVISLDPSVPEGRGGTAEALRSGTPYLCNDVLADERTAPWRALMSELGVKAHACFPLKQGSEVLGALNLYAREVDFFDPELIALLREMALNISFALDTFQRESQRHNAENALRESEERFRSLTQISSDWYWEQDENFKFTFTSNEVVSDTRHSWGDSIIGKTRWEIPYLGMSEQDWQEHKAMLQAHRPFRDMLFKRYNRKGELTYISVSGEPVFDFHGSFKGYRGIGRDITDRKLAEEALRASEQRFRDVVNAAGEYVWETDREWRYTYLSDRISDILRYGEKELLGRKPSEFMPEQEAGRVREWFRAQMLEGGPFSGLEHRSLSRSGQIVWQQVSGVPIRDSAGNLIGYRGTGADITDRKLAEARIQHLATRDPLTELPNRLLLNDRLSHGIINAQRSGETLALFFIDLDRFKTINDSLGHHVGDLLLKQVAARVAGCVRKGDTVSRLGGDEFIVLLEGLREADDATCVAQKILTMLSQPYLIEGHHLDTSCSIGIARYPGDGQDVQTLIRNADTAMYQVKEQGRNNYRYFFPDADRKTGMRPMPESEPLGMQKRR